MNRPLGEKALKFYDSFKKFRYLVFTLQVGEILNKDKSSCTASVQLLRDRDTLLKLDYDVICEYMGDIQAEFDY